MLVCDSTWSFEDVGLSKVFERSIRDPVEVKDGGADRLFLVFIQMLISFGLLLPRLKCSLGLSPQPYTLYHILHVLHIILYRYIDIL